MTAYSGQLRMPGESGPSLGVEVDLSESRMRVLAGETEIGNWELADVLVNAEEDGFHVRVEGEEIILRVEQDAEFAINLGLRSAPPVLRRRMSAILREHE